MFENVGVVFEINGDKEYSLLYVLNLYFFGVLVEVLLVNFDMVGVVVLSGLVCMVGLVLLLYVLIVMFGEESDWLMVLIWISFGFGNMVE